MRKTRIAAAAVLGAALALALGGATAASALAAAPVITKQSQARGHISYGRTVAMTGTDLTAISAMYLGSVRLADLVHVGSTKITFTVPHAVGFAPSTQRFSMVENGRKVDAHRTFRYFESSSVDREMRYLGANLHARGTGRYAYYPNEDCANFTSQVLHARGARFTSAWKPGSAAWVSSTRLRAYLLRSGRAQELTDTQAHRAKVKIGDVVQFDWDRSGDRDHTGVVTKVTKNAKGFIKISYSAHTDMNAHGYGNGPSADRTIEEKEAAHKQALHLHVLGKAYFLHIR